jgi:hypothetical protein
MKLPWYIPNVSVYCNLHLLLFFVIFKLSFLEEILHLFSSKNRTGWLLRNLKIMSGTPFLGSVVVQIARRSVHEPFLLNFFTIYYSKTISIQSWVELSLKFIIKFLFIQYSLVKVLKNGRGRVSQLRKGFYDFDRYRCYDANCDRRSVN